MMGQAFGPPSLYDGDFYSWSLQQADLLRAGRLQEIDVEHLIEEIESSGRSQAAVLEASYRLIAMHLLKLRHQPERSSKSWRRTIIRERLNARRTIRHNPGLKPRCAELFLMAYADARKLAANESDLPLSTFPVVPDVDMGQALDDAYV